MDFSKIRTIVLIILLGLFHFSADAVRASSTDSDTVQVLSKEDVFELALANYPDAKLTLYEMVTADAQWGYAKLQKQRLEESNSTMPGGNLPTSPQFFLQQFPDYEHLSDELKAEINQSIAIQIMINNSLNQWIDAQSEAQNAVNQQEKKKQIDALNDNIRALESEKAQAYLAFEKARELIRYYAAQKYYRLLSMEAGIELAELEYQYRNNRLADAVTLYHSGLITLRELKETQEQFRQQRNMLETRTREYEHYSQQFKLELGLPEDKVIELKREEITFPKSRVKEIAVKLEDNYDLKRLDEQVKHAKISYDAAAGSGQELTSYYMTNWIAKQEQRSDLKRQLEQKLREYKLEESNLYSEIVQLEDTLKLQRQIEADKQTLYDNGLIAFGEVESSGLELKRLELQLDEAKLNYAVFREKIRLASHGAIL